MEEERRAVNDLAEVAVQLLQYCYLIHHKVGTYVGEDNLVTKGAQLADTNTVGNAGNDLGQGI